MAYFYIKGKKHSNEVKNTCSVDCNIIAVLGELFSSHASVKNNKSNLSNKHI